MSLRIKLVIGLAALSILASAGIGVLSYRTTADRLGSEVDRSLDDTAAGLLTALDGRGRPGGSPIARRFRDPALDALARGFDLIAIQLLDESGEVVASSGQATIPVDDLDRRVASAGAGGEPSSGPDRDPSRAAVLIAEGLRRDVSVDSVNYRVLTVARPSGQGAVQVARSLAENERLLDSLRNRMIVLVAVFGGGAAALGWLLAWQLTRRLTRLTAAAERVAGSGRLDVDVPTSGRDEAGRLATAFRSMLAALADSRADQQRLVEDAGHELRTPLTSLRTNVGVLRRHPDMAPAELGRLLDDLDGETRELTDLVNELVELATDRRDDEPDQEVDLAALATRVAARSARRSGRTITVSAVPGAVLAVRGRPAAFERALGNLVDNAVKFDEGASAPVEIVLSVVPAGAVRVEVRDRGPGIDPSDLPHLFDRFYRAAAARSRPGSGLGLSIVKDVAVRHGGAVFATNREGGGAVIGFEVPANEADGNRVVEQFDNGA